MSFLASSAPLTGGIIGGTIGAVLLVLAGIAGLIYAMRFAEMDRGLGMALSAGLIVATVGGWLYGSWPLAYQYHHWIPTEGTVASVGRRIVSDGDGNVSQKFVIRFSDGRVRALDDSIGSTLREGDRAVLKCKRAYDFGVPRSSHGWDCKWAGART